MIFAVFHKACISSKYMFKTKSNHVSQHTCFRTFPTPQYDWKSSSRNTEVKTVNSFKATAVRHIGFQLSYRTRHQYAITKLKDKINIMAKPMREEWTHLEVSSKDTRKQHYAYATLGDHARKQIIHVNQRFYHKRSVKLYRNGGGTVEAVTILHQEKNGNEMVTEGEMSFLRRDQTYYSRTLVLYNFGGMDGTARLTYSYHLRCFPPATPCSSSIYFLPSVLTDRITRGWSPNPRYPGSASSYLRDSIKSKGLQEAI